MGYKIELEQFQGPLDLLLQLIEQQKLDISQVSLAKVTDQYLSYLDQINDIDATELADFLVVATKLLIIKSRSILPQLVDEEEDSADQLEAQLKLYRDYLDASKQIEHILSQKSFCFTREKINFQFEPAFSPPKKMKAFDLSAAFAEVLNRVDYVVNLPKKIMEKTVSLKEMVTNIKDGIVKMKRMSFRNVLTSARSRTEVVVCFIALLELIKQGEIAVNQKGVFDEIMIEKV